MSEHETSGEGQEAVVVMETAGAGSRHKQPYQHRDLQDDPGEAHHKRAKAPAVPSVSDDLKILSEDSTNENVDVKGRKSSDNAPFSENFKQNVSKKLSSSKKKAAAADTPIPEIEMETKVKEAPSPAQPIPEASVSGTSVIDKAPEPKAEKSEDDDITEDTEDLRTAGTVADTKRSEWENQSSSEVQTKDIDACTGACTHAEGDTSTRKSTSSSDCKKGVSWIDHQQYLPKLLSNEMGDDRRAVRLERKPSVGPCKSRTLYEGPSGISFYVPRRPSSSSATSNYVYPQRSGINITISRKCLPVESKLSVVAIKSSQETTRAVMVGPHVPYINILIKLRAKYMNVRAKVKNVLRFDC